MKLLKVCIWKHNCSVVDNSLNRSIKAQVAENEMLLSHLKELQKEKDMLSSALSTVMQRLEALEDKIGTPGAQQPQPSE